MGEFIFENLDETPDDSSIKDNEVDIIEFDKKWSDFEEEDLDTKKAMKDLRGMMDGEVKDVRLIAQRLISLYGKGSFELEGFGKYKKSKELIEAFSNRLIEKVFEFAKKVIEDNEVENRETTFIKRVEVLRNIPIERELENVISYLGEIYLYVDDLPGVDAENAKEKVKKVFEDSLDKTLELLKECSDDKCKMLLERVLFGSRKTFEKIYGDISCDENDPVKEITKEQDRTIEKIIDVYSYFKEEEG